LFIGINRTATIEVVRDLSEMGAGGAVCFASGFSEAQVEDRSAANLQAQLVAAAGDMPILGPNCYGFINALDGALLWPDQHGCQRVERGVAILTQSSNIAINLTMQRRALPIAYVVTCGNMAQMSQAAIANDLLDDPRVTAIGLHIEGFSDLLMWHTVAQKAQARGVPLVALKVGKSQEAQKATISHTASLAGSDAGAQALLDRLGIARVDDLSTFLEALKLLHCVGPLPSNRIASISCSGGEASLVADLVAPRKLAFPPLNQRQKQSLTRALGPMVALANPLDYHTYIWRDTKAMTAAWSAMSDPDIAMIFIIVDYPHTDAREWICATEAAIATHAQTGANVAVVASLPELMPPDVAQTLMAAGVVPMCGLSEAVAACDAIANIAAPAPTPALPPGSAREGVVLGETESKATLLQYGIVIPASVDTTKSRAASDAGLLCAPLVMKSVGIAHKTEAGGVALNLDHEQIAAAAMPTDELLVEEMIIGGVADLIIGITRDPAHGFVLTIGTGGIFAEVIKDTVSLLVPVGEDDIKQALTRLKIHKILAGYRGKPAADIDAIVKAVNALQSYVLANATRVEEVEINPLICTPTRAVAVDALIKEARK
ncbi:MAG: acetate--CoA ligase family protein, partial [Rhodobacterales bacterium]|nr:acetate--CoA ligase family protein [Rhodobacterales bacterium]